MSGYFVCAVLLLLLLLAASADGGTSGLYGEPTTDY